LVGWKKEKTVGKMGDYEKRKMGKGKKGPGQKSGKLKTRRGGGETKWANEGKEKR